ncbi:MAG: transglycosylase SLT domain-containing protein [Solirubrobacterales bacterium]
MIAATGLAGAEGGLATAAALAVALTTEPSGDAPALVAEVGERHARGPTMLASAGARALEASLRARAFHASARGRLAWLSIEPVDGWLDRLTEALRCANTARAAVVHVDARLWRPLLGDERLAVDAAVLRAELPAQRSLTALAVRELHADGIRAAVVRRPPGRVGSRRALAGLEPGGEASRTAVRLARRLLGSRPSTGFSIGGAAAPLRVGRREESPAVGRVTESGQAMPLVLGAVFVLVFCALLLAALGGAVTGKARAQRVADLAALSGARSMRDDFDRLFVPARLANGADNPSHLGRAEYLARARAAVAEAADRNGADPDRLRVRFPDAGSFAPLRVRAEITAELDSTETRRRVPVEAHAEAEAVPPSAGTTGAAGASGAAPMATGGGYSGPLAYREGKPMRPDVAAAFDRLYAAARADGVGLVITSAFRSDAEQAALFAQNPDPQWVAPPGRSLHRCATELDLGPASAYAWLARNAPRFGFLKRYSWEPWHWGFTEGPAPCSAAGDQLGGSGGAGDGAAAGTALPSYVPERFRAALIAAAARWNVSAGLLAAQLMAESNFNPFAVSSAGAQGIAQFMPATAAAYGLGDPFDPEAAIDAQAHLMSDLLGQFGGSVPLALAAYNAGPAPVEACGCVPPYPETQAYVARILGLMEGGGELAAPPLEVRLVE